MKLTEYQISKIDEKVKIDLYKMIVLIDVLADKSVLLKNKLSNIYCITNDYEIIWQVTEVGSEPIDDIDMFVHLGKNDQGEVLGRRFSGFEYEIDLGTGEAEQIRFCK
jgi:hypothetical protein